MKSSPKGLLWTKCTTKCSTWNRWYRQVLCLQRDLRCHLSSNQLRKAWKRKTLGEWSTDTDNQGRSGVSSVGIPLNRHQWGMSRKGLRALLTLWSSITDLVWFLSKTSSRVKAEIESHMENRNFCLWKKSLFRDLGRDGRWSCPGLNNIYLNELSWKVTWNFVLGRTQVAASRYHEAASYCLPYTPTFFYKGKKDFDSGIYKNYGFALSFPK